MTLVRNPEASLAARLRTAPPLADRKSATAKLGDLIHRLKKHPHSLSHIPHFTEGPVRNLCLAIADHSPFLWRLALFDPMRLASLLLEETPERHHRLLCDAQTASATSIDALPSLMRRNRAAHALLVALADIGGVWNVDEVTRSLSEFADASVKGAVDHFLREAQKQGKTTLADPQDPSIQSGLIVLALGKHGAGELNYSSDIDLVVFYDPETKALSPHVEAPVFYAKLARDLAKLLQERTPDGYVHRVDYRLRPDPGSTAVAVSLPAAYAYYETLGQNWERAAFIKARPVGGDLALGEAFLRDLTPFIWRKYFDFAAIADIHAMKRQIHAVRGHDEIAVAGHNIKLGRGGIREIEFFVQTQQLVFGGRRMALRERKTVDMLEALHRESWITLEARDALSAAYRFLRGIEHRLQMVADEQTQRLPDDSEALKRFAKFCGFANFRAFSMALIKQARIVQHHYALLFEQGGDLGGEAGSLVFTGSDNDPDTLLTLNKLGFRSPETVSETVRGWHFGRRPAIVSPRAREVLTEMIPALLKALAASADPDGAVSALDRAFGRMPAAIELLTILKSHERLLELFADLLGTAPRLADTVAQAPHVLDTIIDPAFIRPATEEGDIESRLLSLMGQPASYEDFLDRLRDATRQMRFLAGARMLSGVLSPERAGHIYSAIAKAVVKAALAEVRKAFAADHGIVPGGRLVVLGLGRIGSGEMTSASDLDLVVLYDFQEENRESDGARPLDATVYHTRLTQRLVAALTAPTRRGLLYDVDLRLRPSGTKGPVATQFRSFKAYQQEEAEIWEHMALTRARVLAGDAHLSRDTEQAIRAALRASRDPEHVIGDVVRMRRLVADDKGENDPWDMKNAAGGLTDLDFIAQNLTLSHAGHHPELIARSAPAVYDAATAAGLLSLETSETLKEAYQLQNAVLHWQRLLVEGRFDPARQPAAILKRIAGAAGLPDMAALEGNLKDIRRKVRALFLNMERLSP